jgi:glycosyltransferase involved in cell wall biosynthesis
LKIAFVVPKMEIGGVETFIFRLGRALMERGHSVDVVSAGDKGAWWDRLADEGFGHWCFAEGSSFCPVSHAVKVCRFLRSQRYHIVLLNHCVQVAPALSLLPNEMAVVALAHNDHKCIYEVACANWKAWDVGVGVGERVASVMHSRVPERKIKIIPYGVELPDPQQWSRRATLDDEFKMLFVGRLVHEQKGIFCLPTILADIRAQGIEATLTVVGDGPDRQELRQRLDEVCAPGTFTLLPPLSSDHVYRCMLAHHVFLMPSFYEGLPIAALEAQACGCVPIASRLDGVTDFGIADGETGFLCPVSSVVSFVSAAVRIARDRGLWQEISLAAHERIAQKFTTDVMASRYLELFEQVKTGAFARDKPCSRGPRIDFSVYGWRGLVPNSARQAARKARRAWAHISSRWSSHRNSRGAQPL